MAATQDELARLEADFRSGRNPLAYIPLCQALRRQKQYIKALEFCQKGLLGDSNSIAGRTLWCRLLIDNGRYREAHRALEDALEFAPGSMGLLTEYARVLILLKQDEDAEQVVDELNRRNPLDPQVQILYRQFRKLRARAEEKSARTSSIVIPKAAFLSTTEILRKMTESLSSLVPVEGAAVVPMDAGEPAVTGEVEGAEAALLFSQEATLACYELDQGDFRLAVLDTERRTLFVAVRQRMILSMTVQPQVNIGKVLHRFQLFLSQLFPDQPTSRRGRDDDPERME